MLQFLPVSDGNTIAVRASGKLTHEDYQQFLPELEERISAFEKVSILFELDNFSGWDLDATKDEFKFGLKHLTNFDRIAVVGDKAWERWMTLVAKPFLLSGKVQYFDRENLQDAWDWLCEKQELEKAADQLSPYKQIVAAVDFSAQSKHAVKRAMELATYYKAQLTLLNIAQEAVIFPYYHEGNMVSYPYDYEILENQNKQHIELAKKQMKTFVDSLQRDTKSDTKSVIKTEVLIGDINSTILSYLESQKPDLIVFGSTHKKGVSKLLSSTPRYVQDHARCECLVVPLQASTVFSGNKNR